MKKKKKKNCLQGALLLRRVLQDRGLDPRIQMIWGERGPHFLVRVGSIRAHYGRSKRRAEVMRFGLIPRHWRPDRVVEL